VLISVTAATALVVLYFGISPIWFLVAGAIGGILWAVYRGKGAQG
jgi:hypothetical protein